MSEDETPSGPNLGGPKMPNLSNQSTKGPSLGLDSPQKEQQTSKINEKDTDASEDQTKTKSVKPKINVHELVRRWGVARRRVRDALQTMMLREMKTKVNMTKVNVLLSKNIEELLQGHLNYFEEMRILIDQGDDPLSLANKEEKLDKTVSHIAFDNLTEIITKEKNRLQEESPVITEYIDEDLKRFRDARVEPRASWWVLWYSALQMRELREKAEKELEIILDVIIQYRPVMRRVFGVFVNFLDCLMLAFEDFPMASSRMNLIYNPARTGYNLASWIKPRFSTYSQSYMEYERYIKYYARSFGNIAGNAPDFEGGPLYGYQQWIQTALEDLEQRLRKSSLITSAARGDTLEGMLVGLEDQLKEVLDQREYDEEGKLINQPIGGEGALDFLHWLFETALNRYTTTNIAIQDDTRLHLDMFNFVSDTVRWVNEYGEQLVMDWLDPKLDPDLD